MTRRPTKETTAGQCYLALQREGRRTGRPTDELIQLYALEGFLDRLTKSQYAENFVLKRGSATRSARCSSPDARHRFCRPKTRQRHYFGAQCRTRDWGNQDR